MIRKVSDKFLDPQIFLYVSIEFFRKAKDGGCEEAEHATKFAEILGNDDAEYVLEAMDTVHLARSPIPCRNRSANCFAISFFGFSFSASSKLSRAWR